MVEGTLPVIDTTQNLKLEHGKKVVRITHKDQGDSKTTDFSLQDLKGNPLFQQVIQNHEILTIHTLEASLEDIFIKVTGLQLIQ